MRDSQNTAQTLTESLKYFLKYRDQTVVIKYGGNAMIDEKVKESILKDILLLKSSFGSWRRTCDWRIT